jgi:catechol 2,3-dioxygenase-like lactoylglutathione lyase family enzyme
MFQRSRGIAKFSPVLGDAAYVGFIQVRDTSLSRSFYEGTLGLTILEESPFALVADAHGTRLRITPVPEFAPQPFTVAGWEVPDLDSTVSQLSEAGVEFLRFEGMDQDEQGIWTTPGGDLVAWFHDPDGNVLSLTGQARK